MFTRGSKTQTKRRIRRLKATELIAMGRQRAL